jgi:hypothetical protein
VGERRSPGAGDPAPPARGNLVVDTDRYVRTVAPLATEPSIQDLVVDSLTAKLADPARATDFARELLPPRAEPLAAPIAAAVESFVRDKLEEFVRSDRFGMAVLGLGLLLGRSLYLDAVVSPQLPEDAARAVFDTLLHYLRNGLLIVLVAGLLIAA